MLLFLSDYKTHSGVIHTGTTNETFIKMSVILAKMGIKNNKFFLHLSQPDLAKYDPHNLKDDSVELRQRIAYEVKINPWYYFREVIRIPIAGADAVPYRLSRANLAITWLFFNNIDLFLVMPRQLGKTVSVLSMISWCIFIGAVNSTYGLFTKDNSLVLENISKLKDIRRALPPYLITQSKTDTDNKEAMSYDVLNNEYKTFVNQADPVSASRQGRGETLVSQHWDEFPYYKNNDLSYPSATSASDAASRQAKAHGLPAATIITTTAGYLDTKSGAYAYGVKSGCMRFNELLYDVDNLPSLREVVLANSSNRMLYVEYSYRQLGETQDWFETVTRNKTDVEKATDYLNEWILGTSQPVVNAAILDRITQSITDPTHYTNHKSLVIKWYVSKELLNSEEYKNTPFIIGMDTSNNVGRDFTTIVILEPKTMAVVGTCRCNVSNLVFVASCVLNILETFPNSIIIPERNANGAVLIDIVIEFLEGRSIDPFRRIYNLFIQDYNDEAVDLRSVDLRDGVNRNKFGFKTTSSKRSRDFLYSTVLSTVLDYMADHLHDSDLADEIRGLTVKNGRIDHSAGGHDDLCVGLLLAGYFILFGKNLHMYGLDSTEFFSGEVVDGKIVDPSYKERQEKIYKRISTLKGLIVTTSSGIIKKAYERELKYLETQLDTSVLDANIATADQVRNVVPVDDAPVVNFTANFKRLNQLI